VSELRGDRRWYRSECKEPHEIVLPLVEKIRSDNATRDADLLHFWRLFGGRAIAGFAPDTYSTVDEGEEDESTGRVYDRLPVNVVRRMCTTLQSEVVQNKPRPLFLTGDGDYALQQQAKRANKWTEALFSDQEVDTHVGPRCAIDSCIFGDGFAKVYEHRSRVCIERVFPGEIVVDEQEAIYGKPRTLYQTKFVDRYVLAEDYPEEREQIETAGVPTVGRWALARDTESDQILIVEAWHLPSGPKAKDGRHVICVDGVTLLDEEWSETYFPFAHIQWEEPVLGYWGTGVADILTGCQVEINRLNYTIRNAQSLMGAWRIFLPFGSGVPEDHFTNEDGPVIHFNPQAGAPVFHTAPAVHPEIYQERIWQIQNAFEELGVSQLSAQSQKPAGLNSGKALRIFVDNSSRRFLRWLRAYEAFHVQLAKLAIGVMRRLAERDEDVEIVWQGRDGIEKIKWSQVGLAEGSYKITCFPASFLPNTPMGRLQSIEEMVNTGLSDKLGMSPETLAKLLDFPDLERELNLALAPREDIEKDLSLIVETGEYLGPEPFHNFKIGIPLALHFYLDARRKGVPESTLGLIRRWISDARYLESQAAGQGAPAAPAPAPAPAVPAPPDAAPPLPGPAGGMLQ
jgi:hypothetical protein